MPKLKDFESHPIVLLLFDPNQSGGLQKISVKLLTVDDGGIWVEDQELTNDVLEFLNLPAVPTF